MTMSVQPHYRISPDDNNTFVAYVPAIKGCHAWGESEQEARLELNNVFEMIKEEYLEEGKTLPNDVKNCFISCL